MKKVAKKLPILLLAGLILGEGALVWNQSRELAGIRREAAERERLHAQRESARANERGLRDRLAALAPSRSVSGADPSQSQADRPPARFNFNRSFKSALEDPEFRKLLAVRQKAKLDTLYDPFFRSLKLTPEQMDRLKNLIIEGQLAKTDAIYAAADLGASGSEYTEATVAAQKEVSDQIHQLLGDSDYQQYQQYQQARFLYLAAAQLQKSLSYTAAPLSDDQVNQLVQGWFQATPVAQRAEPTGYMAQVGGGFTDLAGLALNHPLPAQSSAVAQGILSAPQMEVLLQFQQAQQTQQKIAQLARAFNNPGNR